MKIIRNYRQLKKWAKTLFISFLTICIIFTSTGVWSLVAFAEPSSDETTCDHNNVKYEYTGSDQHKVICVDCGAELGLENCGELVEIYTSNDDGTHSVQKVCSKDCGNSVNETDSELCSYVNGECSKCHSLETVSDDNESDSDDSNENSESNNNQNDTATLTPGSTDNDTLTNGLGTGLLSSPSTPLLGATKPSYTVTGESVTYNSNIQEVGRVVGHYTSGYDLVENNPKVACDYSCEDGSSGTVSLTEGNAQDGIKYTNAVVHGGNIIFSATKAGTYTFKITLKKVTSTTTYTDDTLQNLTFTIKPKNISDDDIASTCDEKYSFNVSTGSFSESSAPTGLVKGTDYDVSLPSAVEAGQVAYVTYTGKGNYTGSYEAKTTTIEDVSPLFDGAAKKDSYVDKVVISRANYKVSTSQNGTFKNSLEYTKIGTNQNPTLYYKHNTTGVVYIQKIDNLTIVGSIPVKFDNEDQKESYVNKVIISASGFSVSTSQDGPFVSTYRYDKVGVGQTIKLYFRDNISGEVFERIISDLTIVVGNEDVGSSTGKIIIGSYTSDKIASTNETVYVTENQEKIQIQASNDDCGIQRIEYATSDEAFLSISDINGAVIDEKIKWKPYSDDGKPTLPKDSAVYVYARITDNNGSYNYLSTGKVIHDTVKPVITNAILAAKEDDSNKNVLAITAKDTLSGIEKFYMMYEKKTSDSKTPKEEDIIEKGRSSGVDASDEENAGGSFKISDLNEETTYIFYIVAKDKVGNISDIKIVESKGKGSSSANGSGNSSSQSNPGSGSGLTPAPNGIAGPGNTKTPKTGTTNIPQKTPQEEKTSPLDREIIRVPYISDATGDTKIGIAETGGWDKITNEVKNAAPGISIDVEMSGFSIVPDKVFATMMGKNLNVKFLMPEDVEWIINGQNIESTTGSDIDMGVRIGARNIPDDMLNAIIGTYPHTEIELKHDGDFGFSGILRIPLGESNAGLYAYLYYYDTKAKEMKLLQSTQISSTGYAEFAFKHASDYSIVVRSEEMSAGISKSKDTIEGADTDIDNTSAHKTFRLTDFAGSKASVRMWLFMIAIISAVMCGLILYMPGLKDEEVVEEI